MLGAVRSGQKDLIQFIVPRFPDAGTVKDEATGNTPVSSPMY